MSKLIWNHVVPQPKVNVAEGATLTALGSLSKIMLFGPALPKNNEVNLLSLQTKEWQLQITYGRRPAPRKYHTATYDQSLRIVVIFGGQIAGRSSDDCHLLSVANWSWKKISFCDTPAPRFQHSFSDLRRPDQAKIVFGGLLQPNNTVLQDVWILRYNNLQFRSTLGELIGAESDRLTTTGPCAPRRGHQAEVVGRHLIVVGGVNKEEPREMEVSLLNLEMLSWHRAQPKGMRPASRSLFAMTNFSNELLVFGGKVDGRASREMWILAIGSWSWERLECETPSARFGHASCRIQKNKEQGWLVCGGQSAQNQSSLHIFSQYDFLQHQFTEEEYQKLLRQEKKLERQLKQVKEKSKAAGKSKQPDKPIAGKSSEKLVEQLLLLSKQEQMLTKECAAKNQIVEEILLKINDFMLVLDKLFSKMCKLSGSSSELAELINDCYQDIQSAKSEHILESERLAEAYEELQRLLAQNDTRMLQQRNELYSFNSHLSGLMETENDEF